MTEVRTTSSTGGQKGTKLARFDLVPIGPLTELAEHYGIGASKYANHQWRNGYEWSKTYAALMRHLTAFWAGFDYDVCSNDPEGCSHVDTDGNPFVAVREDACFNHTGSHHLAAVAWHAFAGLEFKDRFPQHDDRYVPDSERGDGSIWIAPLRDRTYRDVVIERLREFDEADPDDAEDAEVALAEAIDDMVAHGGDAPVPERTLSGQWQNIGWIDEAQTFTAEDRGRFQGIIRHHTADALQFDSGGVFARFEPKDLEPFQDAINRSIEEMVQASWPLRFIAGVDPSDRAWLDTTASDAVSGIEDDLAERAAEFKAAIAPATRPRDKFSFTKPDIEWKDPDPLTLKSREEASSRLAEMMETHTLTVDIPDGDLTRKALQKYHNR